MNTASKHGPHTQTDRGTCPGVGLKVYSRRRCTTRGGVIVVLRPLFAAPLVVRRRCLIVVPRPISAAPRIYLIVVRRLLSAAPLVVR
jgi:hypothetical protein